MSLSGVDFLAEKKRLGLLMDFARSGSELVAFSMSPTSSGWLERIMEDSLIESAFIQR